MAAPRTTDWRLIGLTEEITTRGLKPPRHAAASEKGQERSTADLVKAWLCRRAERVDCLHSLDAGYASCSINTAAERAASNLRNSPRQN